MRRKSLRTLVFNRTILHNKLTFVEDCVRAPPKVRITCACVSEGNRTITLNREIALIVNHLIGSRASLGLAKRLTIEVKRERLAGRNHNSIADSDILCQAEHFTTLQCCRKSFSEGVIGCQTSISNHRIFSGAVAITTKEGIACSFAFKGYGLHRSTTCKDGTRVSPARIGLRIEVVEVVNVLTTPALRHICGDVCRLKLGASAKRPVVKMDVFTIARECDLSNQRLLESAVCDAERSGAAFSKGQLGNRRLVERFLAEVGHGRRNNHFTRKIRELTRERTDLRHALFNDELLDSVHVIGRTTDSRSRPIRLVNNGFTPFTDFVGTLGRSILVRNRCTLCGSDYESTVIIEGPVNTAPSATANRSNRNLKAFCDNSTARLDVVVIGFGIGHKRVTSSSNIKRIVGRVGADVHISISNGITGEGHAFRCANTDIRISKDVARERHRLSILSIFIIGDATLPTSERGVRDRDDHISGCGACAFTKDDCASIVFRTITDESTLINRKVTLCGNCTETTCETRQSLAHINGEILDRCSILKAECRHVVAAIVHCISELNGLAITIDGDRNRELGTCVTCIPIVINRDIIKDVNRATRSCRLEGIFKCCVRRVANLSNGLSGKNDLAVDNRSFELIVVDDRKRTGKTGKVCGEVCELTFGHIRCVNLDVSLSDATCRNDCALLDDNRSSSEVRTRELTRHSVRCIFNDDRTRVLSIRACCNSTINNRAILDGHRTAVFKLTRSTNINIGVINYDFTSRNTKHKVARGGQLTIGEIELNRSGGGLFLKCKLTKLFPNAILNIKCERATCTLAATAIRRRRLDISVGHIEVDTSTRERCAGRNQGRCDIRNVCGLCISDRTSNVKGSAVTDDHATCAGKFEASTFTNGNSRLVVACIEHRHLRVTDKFKITISPNLCTSNRLTVTIQLDTRRKRQLLSKRGIQKKNDFIASLRNSGSCFKRCIICIANLCRAYHEILQRCIAVIRVDTNLSTIVHKCIVDTICVIVLGDVNLRSVSDRFTNHNLGVLAKNVSFNSYVRQECINGKCTIIRIVRIR